MITNDLAQTRQRILNLNTYMNANVLRDNRFLCGYLHECQPHTGAFFEGQLHHVGKSYDLQVDGRPLRIVVVGQSYGHPPAKVTIEERYNQVVVNTGEQKGFAAASGLPVRNPHMKGTTSLLRLLFGIPLGTDHESEYIKFSDGSKYHIFDAFALVNYLLCSALLSAEDTTDKSTRIMHQNCRSHFRRTIEILEPTLVVVQGIGFWPSVRLSFDKVAYIDKHGLLYKAQLGNSVFLTAAFSHPSARSKQYGWGTSDHDPYLLEKVVPTVKLIREELFRNAG